MIFLFSLLCHLAFSQTNLNVQKLKFDNYPITSTHKLYNIDLDPQKTKKDSLVLLQEQIKLHVANEQVSNNTIFFKAYIFTGVKQNIENYSEVLNVELLDLKETLVKRQFHRINNGSVNGTMQISENIAPGKYYIKAYTRWMQNYGEDYYTKKEIYIGKAERVSKDTLETDKIRIVSEGGNLLNNYENRIIIPHSAAEKEVEVGKLLDDFNNEIATVKNYSGFATVLFKPLKERSYKLVFKNGNTHPIAKAQEQGYLLRVNNLNPNDVKIQIIASPKVTYNTVKLVGVNNGISYFENEISFKENDIINIQLKKQDLPNGVIELKLVAPDDNILARRPIWIEHEELQISINELSVNNEEAVFSIVITDKLNTPIKTQLAISVNQQAFIDENYSGCNNQCERIEKLRAELSTRKYSFLKDLSLLASNCRDKGIFFKSNEDIKFPVQKGLELYGYAYDLKNTLLRNTNIQIIAKSEEDIWFEEATTDSNGFLKLDKIKITGKAKIAFRTEGEDTKSRVVKIRPINILSKEKNDAQKKEKKQTVYEPTILNPLKIVEEKVLDSNIELSDDDGKLIELKEVKVTENKKKGTPSVYGISVLKHKTKYQDPEKPKSLGQLLSEIPGVTLSGGFANDACIRINRAVAPALWVIDGFPLGGGGSERNVQLGSPSNNCLRPILDLVTATDIERIEVLIGPSAAIYGSRAAGGVILIYTRNGSEFNYIDRKEGELVLQGFEPIKEFSTYKNGLSKIDKAKSNLLYWNPVLKTNENGEAIIKIDRNLIGSKIKIRATTNTPIGKVEENSVIFKL